MFKTYDSYRQSWKAAYKKDPPIPLNVDIELASLCNLSCPFCFISDGSFDEMIRQPSEDGKSRRRLMPKELAFKIIGQAAELGVPALKFNWRGESTIHPDYTEIVRYATNKHTHMVNGRVTNGYKCVEEDFVFCDHYDKSFHELLVNTNANCKPHAIDGLMAATKVMVSLDSLNPNTYRIMRRGGNLELAKSVIGELVQRKHPNLWIRRVITKDNKEEDFFYDVKAHWGNKVKVSEHYCFDRNESSRHEVVECEHEEGQRQYCGYPSQRLVIASTGKVYPCCIDLHEEMPVGDIRTQSLKEIWEGEKIRSLRRELRDGVFKSKACKNCESWMSYKSPKREFVQDKEVTHV